MNIPNGHKIHIPNGHKIYQHFPFQGPPKYTQGRIFGMKICIPSGNPVPAAIFETVQAIRFLQILRHNL
jgi:hypothetical protein